MAVEYVQLGEPFERQDRQALTLPRAIALFDAIQDNENATLIELRRLNGGRGYAEMLVVELYCEEVPPRNPFGIDFRNERLAYIVYADSKALINTCALRKDFPEGTGHQNHVPSGDPASLCLYIEPPAAVYRTWTAEKHIAKTKWWLENAAQGTLHGNDPAPEQFYFISPSELILPADFKEKISQAEYQFVIHNAQERGPNKWTLLSRMEKRSEAREGISKVHPFAIELDKVVATQIEREPHNLGELEQRLQARGTSIMSKLLPQIETMVRTGYTRHPNLQFTLLVVNIPLIAAGDAPDTPPSNWQQRAFFVDADPLQIGADAGVLMENPEQPGNYFIDHLGRQPFMELDQWRKITLEPIEVLQALTPDIARLHSGTKQPGPKAVLAGVGSLGASLFEFWGRSGWGTWTLIDHDHIKPHNLVRFPAWSAFLGWNKAKAMAFINQEVFSGSPARHTPIEADAMDFNHAGVSQALTNAELIVDVTTTLEFPRQLSQRDDVGPAVSVFITPNARDAVMLAEDATRQHRLDVLEPQYYRSIIQEEFGAGHLDGNASKLWSGAGCRDMSVVLNYASVVGHGAVLAQQVQQLPQATPLIRIWQREAETGAVKVTNVNVAQPIIHEGEPFSIIWDEALRAKVTALREQALPNETGGVLLGYYDLEVKKLYVVDVISAPPDSISTAASFERGVQGLAPQIEEIQRRTAKNVGYVGEWHTHPKGVSSRPSGDDLAQGFYLAEKMREEGMPAVMLIVGEKSPTWIVFK